MTPTHILPTGSDADGVKFNGNNINIPIPERVTSAWLKSKGACCEARSLFSQEWPEGGPMTPATLLRAAAIGLDIDWLAQTILTAPAYKAYQEATAPAERAYQEATATAEKAYQEATAPAYKAYQEATAPALSILIFLSEEVEVPA